jgi:hypothetical protein
VRGFLIHLASPTVLGRVHWSNARPCPGSRRADLLTYTICSSDRMYALRPSYTTGRIVRGLVFEDPDPVGQPGPMVV